MEKIWDQILDDGIFSSGFLPFEQPVTPAMVKRMTTEQIQRMILAEQSPEARQILLDMSLNGASGKIEEKGEEGK